MCTSPLYALYKKGEKIQILTKDYIDKNGFTHYNDSVFKVLSQNKQFCGDRELIKIPCGQCLECRINYCRMWSNRLLLESQNYPKNQQYFITLTYDDFYIKERCCTKNGAIFSLRKKDLQDFMKRLRKEFVKHGFNNIRFFASGEYGDKSQRPHYHIILFGLDFQDLIFYKKSCLDFDYFISPTIQKLWKYGISVVCHANWQTMNYTARYILKKHKGQDSSYYTDLDIEPEFCTMSRRPGIGKNYFSKNYKEIYKTDKLYLSDSFKGGFISVPP